MLMVNFLFYSCTVFIVPERLKLQLYTVAVLVFQGLWKHVLSLTVDTDWDTLTYSQTTLSLISDDKLVSNYLYLLSSCPIT